MVYCLLKILGVLNQNGRSCGIIWFSVYSGASYSILIFVDFGIQESNAGFGICELKFYSGVPFVKKDYVSI